MKPVNAELIVCQVGIACEAKLGQITPEETYPRLFPDLAEIDTLVGGKFKEYLRFQQSGFDVFCDGALKINTGYLAAAPMTPKYWNKRARELQTSVPQLQQLYEFVYPFYHFFIPGHDACFMFEEDEEKQLITISLEEFQNA